MKNPKISIITSTFNDSPYIRATIKSVLDQSFKNWEYIIINDASTDNTEKIIKEFSKKDNRIRYYRNKNNQGQTINSNKGLLLVKGEYIARIDGDDIWVDKNKLKKQFLFLEKNSDYGLVGTFAKTINEKGEIIGALKYPSRDSEIRKYILIENCFIHSSVLIRRSIINGIGGYNSKIISGQDYELWLNLGCKSKFYNISEYLTQYRINPKGMTSSNYNLQLKETFMIIKKYKNFYPNYFKGYILWKLRRIVPKKVKTIISKILVFFITTTNDNSLSRI